MSKNLQLIIKEGIQQELPTNINFNYEEIKEALDVALDKYRNIELTEDTYKEGKKEASALRKLQRAMNAKGIEVSKWWNKPEKEFRKKINELIKMIDEPIAAIDAQVDVFEEQKRKERTEEYKEHFKSEGKRIGVDRITSWTLIFQEEWANLSYSRSKAKKEITKKLEQVKSDWATILSLNSPFEADMKYRYLDTLNLQDTIAYGQKLVEDEKKRKDYEKQKAEEQAAKEAVKIDTENMRIDTDNMPLPFNLDPPEEPEQAATIKAIQTPAETEKAEYEPAEGQIYTFTFKVTVTEDQLQHLSDFMTAEKIDFEVLQNNTK